MKDGTDRTRPDCPAAETAPGYNLEKRSCFSMKKDLFSLQNKVAVVTGGNRGIGKAVAGYLADAGADIVLLDLADPSETAAEIAREYGVRTCGLVCDVTDPQQVQACLEKGAGIMGTLDLLFNNAGICIHTNCLKVSPEEWRKVMNVNVSGMFFVAQAFARWLLDHHKTGNIVNTASMSAQKVLIPQQMTSYNASKAAVWQMTRSLAVELAESGIRVNSIAPGYIRTEMTSTVPEELQKTWISSIPFKRMADPSELAGAVIYLLSDASTYTTGACINIDGGITCL